jgi:hypothetical protein
MRTVVQVDTKSSPEMSHLGCNRRSFPYVAREHAFYLRMGDFGPEQRDTWAKPSRTMSTATMNAPTMNTAVDRVRTVVSWSE